MPINKEALKLKAEEELKRRKKMERYRYYKVPSYFVEAAKSEAHTRLIPCPNRVGKSTFVVFNAYWFSMGVHPYRDADKQASVPNESWILGPTLAHVKEVLITEMRKWGLDSFWKSYSEKDGRITWKNGSHTYIKSYDDRKNIQGRSLRTVFIDEECSQDIWYELMMRCTADEQLDVMVAATPIDGQEWFTDLCDRAEKGEAGLWLAPEISIFDAAQSKGGHLSEQTIKRIDQLCCDERERAVRLYGKRMRRAGSVIPLEEKYHQKSIWEVPGGKGEIPKDWIRIVGIDPHARKPTSVVWIAFDPDNGDAWVYDHLKVEGTVQMQVKAIKEKNEGQTIFAMYIDPASREAMSNNLQTINWNYYDDFSMQYPTIPLILSIKSRPVVIDAIKHRVSFDPNKQTTETNRPHLFILEHLQDLWKSIRSVKWKEFRDRSFQGANTKTEVGKDDDMMALGYALVKHPLYITMNSAEEYVPEKTGSEIINPEMGY